MFDEIECVAALDAQKLAVDAAAIAIIAANNLSVTHAERGLASIRAVRADSADVLHLPRTRLVAITTTGQRADGANVDAGAAFIAFQMIVMVGKDFRNRAAVRHAQRAHTHAFVTYAHAAVAQDAARRIKKYHRRPLLLIDVLLPLGKAAFARAVAEHHVLQLALAAFIANGTIQRMIGQQEFERALARF